MIPLQNTTTTAILNATTQSQNTTTVPNIFNLISQLMGMTTEATARESNFQNNTTSNVNTGEGHFSHFGTIGAYLFRGFEAFRRGNNNSPLRNNNNNNLPSLPSPGFGGGLEGDFNSPPEGNAKGLDPNITALVNTLTGANLEINQVERESNHVKLTEFEGTEVEDPNK